MSKDEISEKYSIKDFLPIKKLTLLLNWDSLVLGREQVQFSESPSECLHGLLMNVVRSLNKTS